MKRFLSYVLAIVLVICIGLVGASPASADPVNITGNYSQDTVAVINSLRETLQIPQDAPEHIAAQAQAKKLISDFASRYRRDPSLSKLASFTTMRTALNSLAGHYTSYPNRPVPQKMKDRLEQEFKQVEVALQRGG
ncbi:MAG: photosystem II protein Psb27 [Leptolyngbyaceae cyanobacterium bins.349]|nr:photosystem II protein Psb27 [Leptolyngbyaceae cyanobacterium bins.349]